jgi:hypothetical protein
MTTVLLSIYFQHRYFHIVSKQTISHFQTSLMRRFYDAHLVFLDLIMMLIFFHVFHILKLNNVQVFFLSAKKAGHMNVFLERVILKCVYNSVIHCCIVCQIVINGDSLTLGSLLSRNTHFVFLMCVVYVLYCICNFVCCVLVWSCVLFCVVLICVIVVPLPPGTNPFAGNNNYNIIIITMPESLA